MRTVKSATRLQTTAAREKERRETEERASGKGGIDGFAAAPVFLQLSGGCPAGGAGRC